MDPSSLTTNRNIMRSPSSGAQMVPGEKNRSQQCQNLLPGGSKIQLHIPPFLETIKESTLARNEAYVAAGFRNAVEVKVQPDDAEWDAGDIRYNVLRWTSSPNPPFGGYGPSFLNPRTGQFLTDFYMVKKCYKL